MDFFTIKKELGAARLTELKTTHGSIQGPFFQVVATQAATKGLVYSEDLEQLGVQIVLANTYHLHVRPGEELIQQQGGLHQFMQWSGPITTDSGGYQVFSLSSNLHVDKDGVTFNSPLDGAEHRLTPEKTVHIQHHLGSDIIMPLDIATAFDADRSDIEQAVTQTTLWAQRCRQAQDASASPAKLYGIVQGGLHEDLRSRSASELQDIGFDGYSIGGELRDQSGSRMDEGVALTVKYLPADKPRYLMGAGSPADLVRAVRRGIDHFDCVLPVRDGRHGRLYYDLDQAELAACMADPDRPVVPANLYEVSDLRKARHRHDTRWLPSNPVMEKDYTFSYLHHLIRSEPPSGYRLAVLNNIHFYMHLMQSMRDIIASA